MDVVPPTVLPPLGGNIIDYNKLILKWKVDIKKHEEMIVEETELGEAEQLFPD